MLLTIIPLFLACNSDPQTNSTPTKTMVVEPITSATPTQDPSKNHHPVEKSTAAFLFPTENSLDAHPDKEQILRGKALITDTAKQMPNYVGAKMNCSNCHLQAGTTPNAMPFVGVVDRYPRYRSRSGKEDNLTERINGCFLRSMNGQEVPAESPEMKAILSYMDWISSDVEDGNTIKGAGVEALSPLTPDPVNGKKLYQQKCIACHQANGQGMFLPDGKILYPALWGEHSFNIGAGMARLDKAAAFIKWNMPLGQGGTLSDQEAFDIASYFTVQDRPDFTDKSKDWPKGDKPTTARY